MKILALEFSSDRRSVAVAQADERGFRVLAEINTTDPRRATGMVLVDRALSDAGAAPAEISLIAAGLGPGSYAGIRSAIAIAQGWQLGRGTRLLGIGSLEVLARDAQARGWAGEVSLIIDAQRTELYEARYFLSPEERRVLEPLRIIPAAACGRPAAGPGAARLSPGALDLWPRAATLAAIAASRGISESSEPLEPVTLRETSFLKAPPAASV